MPAESPVVDALAVGAEDAARLCGVSRACWWKLTSSGRCPAPVRIGRRCVWAVDRLKAWLAAGAPAVDPAAARAAMKAKRGELAGLGKDAKHATEH